MTEAIQSRGVRALAKRHGLLMALVLSGGLVGLQQWAQDDVAHTRFDLPDFEACVNVASAEHPTVLTQAPWGFRVLTPWIVHSLPVPKATRGFRYLTHAALTAAGVILFLLLRRRGLPLWASLATVALFAVSEPVGLVVAHGFRTEPVDLLLVLLLLHALEVGAGPGVLALVLTLATLSSDLPLLLLPAVVVQRGGRGWRRVTIDTLVAALPAVAAALLLRGFWSPTAPAALGAAALTPEAAGHLRSGVWEALGPVTLGAIVPLAALGAARREGRRLLRREGYLLLATTALPFFPLPEVARHSTLADAGAPMLLVALALWLPLAAIGLARPTREPATPPASGLPVYAEVAAFLAAVATLGALGSGLDGYRRADLGGRRDGPLALALTRESLRTARRLGRGESVRLDASQRYAWGLSDPGRLGRMRWYLWSGWGDLAHYGIGEIVMREAQARLLLPCLRPVDLEARFVLESSVEVQLAVFLNGGRVGNAAAGPGGRRSVVALAQAALFRGDNVLTLAAKRAAPDPVKLRELTYRPAHR
jgi:hypothetical protein